MALSDSQLDRYARHIVLREIGGDGQKKLLGAEVVVIGAGGIGSPAIQYLAAAGVGLLTIIDDDRVELANLQRQTLFGTADIGHEKARQAKKAVAALNPDVAVDFSPKRINADNADRFIEKADVVLDGSDNLRDAAGGSRCGAAPESAVGLRLGSRIRRTISVFRGWEADKPCYRCFVGTDPGLPEQSCSEQGVLGALAGVMGSLAALEAIRAITGFGQDSAGKLLLVDALSLRFRSINLPKDPGCPACGG